MNTIKRTTLRDRLKNAICAFRGKPIGSIQYGLQINRCDECEYKNVPTIRDNLLVTAGARAAYMHSKNIIDIPDGLEGEDKLAAFITNAVDAYLNSDGVNFDIWIERALLKGFGVYGSGN